jgi:penicillin amidase
MPLTDLPPWFVRNGQGGSEWLPVQNPQPYQATPREILPFSEHPQVVNPRAGYFVNGNNDPAGVTRDNDPLNQARQDGHIFYMAYSWNRGFRAARIDKRVRELLDTGDRRVSFEEMQSIQADVVVRDGEVLAPYIVAAFDRPMTDPVAEAQRQALVSDPAIAEAVGRLRGWNGWTPTGIAEGYDESDTAGALQAPSANEAQASIAASIYAAWRSRILSGVINGTLNAFGPLPAPDDMDSLAALRHLFQNGGASASGLNFFNVPGVASAADRRDIVILKSLRDGLNMLATKAFFGSTNQNDYRWGRLHRVVFAHPLDAADPAHAVFSLPPNGASFSTDGGFQTVDASTHNARGQAAKDFMFKDGPNHRTVVEARREHMRAESIWPGGTSGVPGNPNYAQFLTRWLANDSIPLHLGNDEVARAAVAVEKYVPAE